MDFGFNVLASIVGSLLIGGATCRAVLKKSRNGIKQSGGTNQVAFQKSKRNKVYIGDESNEKED